jgi:hypothetical protein
VPHETTTPSSPHPRVSTRTTFVRLLDLLPSYSHSRQEPSPACSTDKNPTQPSAHARLHPPAHRCAASCLTSTTFKSHSLRRTSGFLQVAVLKAPPHPLRSSRGFPWGRFQYSPKTYGPRRRESVLAHNFRVARDPGTIAQVIRRASRIGKAVCPGSFVSVWQALHPVALGFAPHQARQFPPCFLGQT